MQSRLESDPDFESVHKIVNSFTDEELAKLAYTVCCEGAGMMCSDELIVEEIMRATEKSKEIPVELSEKLIQRAHEVDSAYLDLLNSEGSDDPKCMSLFARARILTGFVLYVEGTSDSLIESVYEIFIGTHRSTSIIDIIRNF